MDKYDLKSEGPNYEGTISVLEYQQGKRTQKRSFNNVFAKNFSTDPNFTDEQFEEIFKPFGKLYNACVMRDHEGKSKGFGFACFEDPASAEKAVQELNAGEPINGEPKLYVGEAKKKTDRTQQLQINNFKYKKSIMFFSLFVKNFPAGTTEEELRIFFSSASNGEVTKV